MIIILDKFNSKYITSQFSFFATYFVIISMLFFHIITDQFRNHVSSGIKFMQLVYLDMIKESSFVNFNQRTTDLLRPNMLVSTLLSPLPSKENTLLYILHMTKVVQQQRPRYDGGIEILLIRQQH